MKIEKQQSGTKGGYFVQENDLQLAEMTFVMSGAERMIIDHTGVDNRLRGRGIGKQLVAAAVADAREHNFKILPLCPFAAAIFEKVPEFGDVLGKA